MLVLHYCRKEVTAHQETTALRCSTGKGSASSLPLSQPRHPITTAAGWEWCLQPLRGSLSHLHNPTPARVG